MRERLVCRMIFGRASASLLRRLGTALRRQQDGDIAFRNRTAAVKPSFRSLFRRISGLTPSLSLSHRPPRSERQELPQAADLGPRAKRLRRLGRCDSLPLRWSAEVCHFRTFTADQVAGPKRRVLLLTVLSSPLHAQAAVYRKRALSVGQRLGFLPKAGQFLGEAS